MSFDDLLKDLQAQRAQDDPGTTMDGLFNPSFMRRHSNCDSFREFLDKGNFHVKTLEDIDNVHDELFDRHVARETDFNDWKSMLDAANREFAGKA